MSDLRKAAQDLVDRWDTPLWKDAPHTGTFIDALRVALAQPEKTNQCAETCERAKLCAVCASVVDDVKPEPVAKVELMTTGGNVGLATRIVEIDDHLRERLRPGQLLYNSPPQRKPLTEEEIEVIRVKEEFDQWGIREGAFKYCARAIERKHGIGV